MQFGFLIAYSCVPILFILLNSILGHLYIFTNKNSIGTREYDVKNTNFIKRKSKKVVQYKI